MKPLSGRRCHKGKGGKLGTELCRQRKACPHLPAGCTGGCVGAIGVPTSLWNLRPSSEQPAEQPALTAIAPAACLVSAEGWPAALQAHALTSPAATSAHNLRQLPKPGEPRSCFCASLTCHLLPQTWVCSKAPYTLRIQIMGLDHKNDHIGQWKTSWQDKSKKVH